MHNRHYFDKNNYQSSLYPYSDTLRIGYGIGAYHTKEIYNWADIKYGAEFTLLRRYEGYQSMSHLGYYSNIEFSLFYLDFPLSLRLYVGNRFKVFFEYGGYLAINYMYITYDYYSVHPDPSLLSATISTGHSKKSGFYHPWLHLSVFAGLGMCFPAGKHEFIIQGQIRNALTGTYSDLYYSDNNYYPISLCITAGFRL